MTDDPAAPPAAPAGAWPHRSALGDPIGAPISDWSPPPRPTRAAMIGRWAQLEPLTPAHAPALQTAFDADHDARMWTYLPMGPFESETALLAWLEPAARGADPLFFSVVVAGRPLGVASYLRIDPEAGSIEIGWLAFAPALQRTRAATEALVMMASWAFEAGYRRLEWKCDALNAASRRAAERLGLSFEGVFRQARIAKGRNRDTAWFAAIDAEWPALKAAYAAWRDPANFDDAGRQRVALSSLTAPILVRRSA